MSLGLWMPIIKRFALVAIKDTWYANYLNCNQGSTETIEGYTNQFKKLFKRVDPNAAIPVANVICQYMVRINPSIAPLVYTRGPVTLQAAVNAAKSIEAGFRITQRNGVRSNFTIQQPVENRMEVLAATLEKILLKREKKQFSRSNLKGSRKFICWKYGEPGYISTTCESEKVLPT